MRETWQSGVFELLDPEILDHRIRQQLAAHVLDLGIAGAVGKVELDQLACAHVVHARKTQPLESMMDRLALGVEHTVLESNEDARFHRSRLAVPAARPLWSRSEKGASFTVPLPCTPTICGCRSVPYRPGREPWSAS